MSENTISRGPSGLILNRRSFLRGAAGMAGMAALGPVLAACGSSAPKSGATASATTTGAGTTATTGATAAKSTGTISFGSNYSDPSTKAAFATLVKQAEPATGVKISVNTVDHNTFQNDITSYLQGTPNDLFTWFAGYRMQFFAQQNLLSQIDDVWEKIGPNFNEATKNLSKGLDGHYYFVPLYNYPWVVWYNKSTFQQKGYAIPTTWADFMTLTKQMQKDKLIPLAFADKDLWPALGMFDIFDLRINGYDYHIKLMKHEVPWTDKGVTAVFDQWAELMPYLQSGANGRIWQDAATTLENKQAGMMFQGSNQVAANYAAKNLPDLDFFPFPEVNAAYGQDYMDAPADGFCLSRSSKNAAAAKSVLEYIGTGPAEAGFLQTDHWDVGLATGLIAPTYNAIQKKSVTAIAACKAVSQFGDRDTDPGFASNVLEPAIQTFIGNPKTSAIVSLQKSIEAQAKTIFTS
jgi:multiple sugar transport system substrate-binding protein